jgi:drug/metabolite transporter (DMT)-like permease
VREAGESGDSPVATLSRVISSRTLGLGLVIVSAIGFGSGGLFAKPVYAVGVGFVTLLAWRFLLAAILAWGSVALQPGARRAMRTLPRRDRLVAIVLGMLYVAGSGTYYASLETVPVSLAALLVCLYPPLVAVLALRFGRRLPGIRAWAALGIAVMGMVLALGGIEAETAPPLLGLGLAVASPLVYACWMILAARLSGERTGRTGRDAGGGTSATVATAIMVTATAAIFWTVAIVSGTPVMPGSFPTEAWPGIVGLAVVATFIPMQAIYAGAQRVGAAEAALLSTVEPLSAIILAALIYDERLEPIQLAGGALVLIAVVLAQTARGGAGRPRVGTRPQASAPLAREPDAPALAESLLD